MRLILKGITAEFGRRLLSVLVFYSNGVNWCQRNKNKFEEGSDIYNINKKPNSNFLKFKTFGSLKSIKIKNIFFKIIIKKQHNRLFEYEQFIIPKISGLIFNN
ncbi:MAG: hypothetical protein AUJ98_02840 [Bacteroidetes bacterium CG2_30_33_31]|nr:MAG: hypothetical protein AUJ98_02840 [Bacteroidetes bacterium CG2_30_33_31]